MGIFSTLKNTVIAYEKNRILPLIYGHKLFKKKQKKTLMYMMTSGNTGGLTYRVHGF